MMKTLLIGLGNPILGDDGVGWRVAEAISNAQSPKSNLEIDRLSLGGLSLMERMIGYDRVILIDALVTGQHPLGYVSSFTLSELLDHAGGHTTAAHDTSLLTALRVGKQLGAHLPTLENIWIVGIEARHVNDFSEELSPPIAAAIPQAVEQVLLVLVLPQLTGGKPEF
jgi:hydrogenase maturation protease